MSNYKSQLSALIAALFFITAMTESAYAYVDPGSGSVIVTTVLGFIAAIGYTFRKTFYNLKRKFGSEPLASDKGASKND